MDDAWRFNIFNVRKTWIEKMNIGAKPRLVRLEKAFCGAPAGSKMLVATSGIVRDYMKSIKKGKTQTVLQMRIDLAKKYRARITCPTSSGIFVRIASEAALEELAQGKSLTRITPFWRLVDPDSPAASKISCGAEFIRQQRAAESKKG